MNTLNIPLRASLPAEVKVPVEFAKAYLSQDEMIAVIGIEPALFWNAYKRGWIPTGIDFLVGDEHQLVWERAFVDEWLKAGMPALPGVIEREEMMKQYLIQTVCDEHPEMEPILKAELGSN